MNKLDDTKAIQVYEDIWWVGFADYEAGFSNNPYLLVDGNEAVLFDPGPAHPVFRDIITQKIEQIINPEKIKYIVVHHQDPDLCGLIPYVENLFHPDLIIISHPRTALFIPYYGTRKSLLPVGESDILKLESGREIIFYHTPYLHFAGNMFSYDTKSKSLFSGDVFAVFNRSWNLYADESYLPFAKDFIEHYISDKKALDYAYNLIQKTEIDRILPQHGGIVEKDFIELFTKLLKETQPGRLLSELQKKPTKEETQELLTECCNFISKKAGKDFKVDSVQELMDQVIDFGPSVAATLIEIVDNISKRMNILNPLNFGRIHKWKKIQTLQASSVIDSIRMRYLSRQYSMFKASGEEIDTILKQGLQSFKIIVAVMFIDIRQFTKWSHKRSSGEVVEMLNHFHGLITKIINTGGGRVNKIIGDGILAYINEENLDKIVPMIKKIDNCIQENQLPEVGIGIDYGDVIMGDIGQEARLDYTLIGNVVNIASRMCDNSDKGEATFTERFVDCLNKKTKEKIDSLPSKQHKEVSVKANDPVIPAVKFKISEYTASILNGHK